MAKKTVQHAIARLFAPVAAAIPQQQQPQVEAARRRALKAEIHKARRALKALLREGPLAMSPETIAGVDTMSDVEVLKLKYEMREFLRALARRD